MTDYEKAHVDALNEIAAAIRRLSEPPQLSKDEAEARDLSVLAQKQRLRRELEKGEPTTLDLEKAELEEALQVVNLKQKLATAVYQGFKSVDDPLVKKYFPDDLPTPPERRK